MAEPLRLMLWHWGRRGGGPRYTYELARALRSRGDVELHLSLSRQSELFAATAALGDRGFHVDTYRDAMSFLLRVPAIPVIAKRFLAYLRRNRIDVVYNTMDFLWGALVAPAIRNTDALYLLAVHDATRHPGEDGLLRQWLLKRDISAADGAITMTDAVRTQLLTTHDLPADRVWTAPLGVFIDPGSAQPRTLPQQRPVRLLFFGRILPYKGLDMLLQAMPLIRARNPQAELEIWGWGQLDLYRDALRTAEAVTLHEGWIDESKIPEIFARTDVCVLPYKEASQSAVVATALASGMPIVTTPISGLVEQIFNGRAGRIATDFSPQAFADATVSLVSDAKLFAELSSQALQIAHAALSWDAIAARIIAAAEELRRKGRKP